MNKTIGNIDRYGALYRWLLAKNGRCFEADGFYHEILNNEHPNYILNTQWWVIPALVFQMLIGALSFSIIELNAWYGVLIYANVALIILSIILHYSLDCILKYITDGDYSLHDSLFEVPIGYLVCSIIIVCPVTSLLYSSIVNEIYLIPAIVSSLCGIMLLLKYMQYVYKQNKIRE